MQLGARKGEFSVKAISLGTQTRRQIEFAELVGFAQKRMGFTRECEARLCKFHLTRRLCELFQRRCDIAFDAQLHLRHTAFGFDAFCAGAGHTRAIAGTRRQRHMRRSTTLPAEASPNAARSRMVPNAISGAS